ncbi:hypothetical protein C8J57DRAFT_1514106 [Mycena rebaudengoi]|nr:hypothetical protein C8J57DRAFT_1575482 [Mycena rebaudengoi]KAJ7261589.1 hypothetical protein C8J57DRAFT_1514106 [Mycena rebaudengoi]
MRIWGAYITQPIPAVWPVLLVFVSQSAHPKSDNIMFIKVLFALGVTLMELVHAAPEQHSSITDPGSEIASGTYIIYHAVQHGDRRDNLYSSMEQDRFVYLYSPWKIDAYGQWKVTRQLNGTYRFLNVGLPAYAYVCDDEGYNKICSGVGSGMAKFFNISKGGQQGMFTIGNADSSILWTVLDQGRGEVNLTAPDTDNPQSHLWTFELIDDYSMPQSLM